MAKLSWTIKLSVDKLWVADGFDLTEERAVEMLLGDLQFATSGEVDAEIIEAPPRAEIRKIQGYED